MFRAHFLQTSMQDRSCFVSDIREKMLIRISLGSAATVGRHSWSETCMSCRLGTTPKEDCESLAPRKKSDSSLSAGTGELVDDDDRESLESSDIMMAGGRGLAVTEEPSRAGAELEAPEALAAPTCRLVATTWRAGAGGRILESGGSGGSRG